ncbi:MAG: O-acetylhomoserine aminocarboxypropyltransferase/cysteine synthase family protein [Verrucomicrobiales bacterium]|jgi:O-acetylhomoserine (thiol)-lyase|nr:O-acetylhomoserine aminocarboxypropyltransferase/cysteine synthase [Verrucomicrobiales bacterium]MDB3940151.1 O-acetylhomoserine aminocarboxypropyltransferase/cysteine synthase [Verrucomicrobiales bacterium]MDC0252209.1 O-acetylhomoserine aminocarboxypropyltransferase/cysteine synthase [bacterium]MDC3352674.1 O-acetylhomoserine aminocarboxypropyltransferase/cysteine synthase [Verrucomicrobiales bacterium]
MKIETLCLHGGHTPDPTTNARAVPVYRTSSFVFNSTEHAANLFALKELGNIYTRLMNPTTDVLEKRVALLEGGPEMGGLGVASGTSAVFYSIINLAQAGDNIVSARNLYGGTYTQFNDILPALGITVKFVDSQDPQAFADAIDDKTRAVFCETVSNPALEVVDLAAVADVAHAAGLPLVVDSTFSTPYLTRPIEHGADIVIHSLTKWMGGHGAGIGGVVVDSGTFNWAGGKHPLYDEPDNSYHGLRWGHDLPEPLSPLAFILRMRTVPLRNLGACIAPDNAWFLLQGIETLPLRMERHCANSLAVAKHLEAHDKVEWVRFPGLESDPEFEKNQKYLKGKGGSMVVFGIKGGAEAGQKFIENLNLFSHLANVGDAKSLAIHPATTTHSQLNEEQQAAGGISPELIRLSVGIENIDDILADLDAALASA